MRHREGIPPGRRVRMSTKLLLAAAVIAGVGLTTAILVYVPRVDQRPLSTSPNDKPRAVTRPAGAESHLETVDEILGDAGTSSEIDPVPAGRIGQRLQSLESVAAQPALSTIAIGQILQQDLELLPPIPEFEDTVRRFAIESDDTTWSEATEARILNQVSSATGLSLSDVQVDCRTSMCRVQFTDPRSTRGARYSSFNELVETFGLESLWLWAGPDAYGTPITLSYLRRNELNGTQSDTR